MDRPVKWRTWWNYHPGCDHDHCAFCWAKFPWQPAGDDHVSYDDGWVTADDDCTWICPVCFEDYKDRFGWTVEA
jgi:hypothetical protein